MDSNSESEVSILKKRKKSGKSFSEVSNSDHEHPGSRQHHRADNSSESLKFRSKTMLSAAADDDADDFVDSSQPPPKKKKKKKKQQQSDDEENHVKEHSLQTTVKDDSEEQTSQSEVKKKKKKKKKIWEGDNSLEDFELGNSDADVSVKKKLKKKKKRGDDETGPDEVSSTAADSGSIILELRKRPAEVEVGLDELMMAQDADGFEKKKKKKKERCTEAETNLTTNSSDSTSSERKKKKKKRAPSELEPIMEEPESPSHLGRGSSVQTPSSFFARTKSASPKDQLTGRDVSSAEKPTKKSKKAKDQLGESMSRVDFDEVTLTVVETAAKKKKKKKKKDGDVSVVPEDDLLPHVGDGSRQDENRNQLDGQSPERVAGNRLQTSSSSNQASAAKGRKRKLFNPDSDYLVSSPASASQRKSELFLPYARHKSSTPATPASSSTSSSSLVVKVDPELVTVKSEKPQLVEAIIKVVSSRKRNKVEDDFIDAALTSAEKFDSKLWPTDLSMSIHRKFPEVGEGGHPLLKTFVNFCRKFDHRPLPELNADNPFKSKPRKDVLEALKKKYPGFRSGRFSGDENQILQKNLGRLAATLQFSKSDLEVLLLHLTERLSVTLAARLYFGAVIGWELLEYRLAIDIFSHLLGLIHLSRQDAVLENEKNVLNIVQKYGSAFPPPKMKKIVKDLDLDLEVSSSRLKLVIDNAEKEQSGENSLLESGKFSIEDSCTLLKLVLNQQRTSNFEDVDYDKIDFDAIAQQMLRKKKSVRQHFNSQIVVALKTENVEGCEEYLRLNTEFFHLILADDSIKSRQDINWSLLAKKLNSTTEKLRNVLNSSWKPSDDRRPENFRQAIQLAAERTSELLDSVSNNASFNRKESRSYVNVASVASRHQAIRDFYHKHLLTT